MESILNSVKKIVNVSLEDDSFDQDLIIYTNTILAVLTQMGVGPVEGFVITGEEETWDDFVGDDIRIQLIKTYVGLRVRMMFDPPTNSSAVQAFDNSIQETQWRIYAMTNYGGWT